MKCAFLFKRKREEKKRGNHADNTQTQDTIQGRDEDGKKKRNKRMAMGKGKHERVDVGFDLINAR